jgi:hypothetical protein
MDSGKERLLGDWFAGRVAVAWGSSKTVVASGRLLLGAYAVRDESDSDVGFLAHEMGHLVEIDDRRATSDNFGLRYKRVVRLPPTRYSSGIHPEPLTAQGVVRECRVIAISTRILEAVGWGMEARAEESERTIAALRHMQDWYNIPGKRSDDVRREWCRKRVARSIAQWPVERVRAEWWRKVVLVTRRLERAAKRTS